MLNIAVTIPIRLSFFLIAIAMAQLEAATIHVPATYSTIQQAINAASAGDVIVVSGGSYQPIVISKPITIMGKPGTIIDNSSAAFGAQTPNVTLSGPGNGKLVLVGLEISGTADLMMHSAMGSRIVGSGFTELHLLDCQMRVPKGKYPTGAYESVDCIDVVVTRLYMARSEATGAAGGIDGAYHSPSVCSYVGQAGAGIRAIGATVVVLDSTVKGGPGPSFSFDMSAGCPSLGIVPGGGHGIVAGTVFHAGSVIAGGSGTDVYCQQPGGTWVSIGKTADGTAIVAGTIEALDNKLWSSQSAFIGSSWSVSWSTSGNPTLLVSGPLDQPLSVWGHGWLFCRNPQVMLITLVPGGQQTVSFPIPASPSLVNLVLAVQLDDPATGLTRPIITAFRM